MCHDPKIAQITIFSNRIGFTPREYLYERRGLEGNDVVRHADYFAIFHLTSNTNKMGNRAILAPRS